MSKYSRSQTILLIIFLITVWALNWPLSKIALSYSSPILFSGIRTLVGGLLLLIIAIPRYRKLNFKRVWPIYLISALFNVALYHGLSTIGLIYMPSGLLSAIIFLQPVLVGIIAWKLLGETMTSLKLVGLVLGFLGVALMSIAGISGHISVIGIVLALGSALSWAIGTVYVKKIGAAVDSIWLVTMQFIVGGLVLTLTGTGLESWSDINWDMSFILCLSFISIFTLALGWLVYFELILAGEATRIASYTFLIPTAAVLMGTLFMDEQLTVSLIIGLVCILVSIYFVNRAHRPSGIVTSEGKSEGITRSRIHYNRWR